MITIISKTNSNNTKVKTGDNYQWTLEEGNEDYIKREMRVDG